MSEGIISYTLSRRYAPGLCLLDMFALYNKQLNIKHLTAIISLNHSLSSIFKKDGGARIGRCGKQISLCCCREIGE